MSSYAFFVQTFQEEHPDASVNFSGFSNKFSESWQTSSAKEKGKCEDMAKADKAQFEIETKVCILPKRETKEKFKDPSAPKRLLRPFSCFVLSIIPKVEGEHPGLFIGDAAKQLGEMWSHMATGGKQPNEKKVATLKEKYGKVIAVYRT